MLPDELLPGRLVVGMSLGVLTWPGEQALVCGSQVVKHLELPVTGEDRVIPLHVVEHRRGDGAGGSRDQAGGAEAGMQRLGLADPELAEHGTPQP